MTMNWHDSTSIQLVISDLNEIAADLYRHRIRPASRKGGSGVYDMSQGGLKYVLPPRLSANIRATFSVTEISADRVSLKAVSSEDSACCVTANVDGRGRLIDIVVPGEGPCSRREDRPLRRLEVAASGSANSHSVVFFDDMS